MRLILILVLDPWSLILSPDPNSPIPSYDEDKPQEEGEALRLLSCQSVTARLTSGEGRDEDGFFGV